MEKFFPKESKVKGVRLLDHMELVAEIETLENGDITLRNPLRTVVGMSEEGVPTLDFAPISLVIPEVVTVPASAIAMKPFNLMAELEDNYLSVIRNIQTTGSI